MAAGAARANDERCDEGALANVHARLPQVLKSSWKRLDTIEQCSTNAHAKLHPGKDLIRLRV